MTNTRKHSELKAMARSSTLAQFFYRISLGGNGPTKQSLIDEKTANFLSRSAVARKAVRDQAICLRRGPALGMLPAPAVVVAMTIDIRVLRLSKLVLAVQ